MWSVGEAATHLALDNLIYRSWLVISRRELALVLAHQSSDPAFGYALSLNEPSKDCLVRRALMHALHHTTTVARTIHGHSLLRSVRFDD